MDALKFILIEDEEEDDFLQLFLLNKRQPVNSIFKTRDVEGCYNTLINGHLFSSDDKFREYFRLNKQQFEYILHIVENDLVKQNSNAVKHPISPGEKLALTLRFLATGESYRSLSFSFRISHGYISIIIRDTLAVMREKLVPILLPTPTRESLKEKANDFLEKCDFPNCIGAIDGKHVRIFCPEKSGSLYFNYKNYFSIVLLALVDSNCKFVVINVGSYGKEGDSGIFARSTIGKLILSGELFPEDKKLPNTDKVLPYVIVGDEAFRLHKHIMKPFSKTSTNNEKEKNVFNSRLSRARRVSENAFGLLCQVFRVFYTPISVKPNTCDDIITVCCCLHNLLRDAYLERNGRPFFTYDPDIETPCNITPLKHFGGFADANGFSVRQSFMEYFLQEGALSWQEKYVSRLSSKKP